MTRTVAHEHLRASLRVVGPVENSCDCHGGFPHCPSLDTLARLHEGQLPTSYAPESFGLQDYSAFDWIVWAVALSAALVTGYSLAGLVIQWVGA